MRNNQKGMHADTHKTTLNDKNPEKLKNERAKY